MFFFPPLESLFSVAVPSKLTNLIGVAYIKSHSQVITLAIYLWRD